MRAMKTLYVLAIGALFLVLGGSACQSEAMGRRGHIGVSVSLPAVRFAAPPDVVVIPGTYVYMVPDVDADILFFQGSWWRSHEGRWYRSRGYNGAWGYVEPRGIPRGLRELPQDFRHRLSRGHERIRYRDLQRNWSQWEKEKYWDRRNDQNRRGYGDQNRRGYGDQNRGRYGDQDRRGQGEQRNRY